MLLKGGLHADMIHRLNIIRGDEYVLILCRYPGHILYTTVLGDTPYEIFRVELLSLCDFEKQGVCFGKLVVVQNISDE
jgi:hypothetical protein